MLKTKIVATIGPACDTEEKIAQLYKAGMRIARLNFSHGSHEYFLEVIKKIRNVSTKIAILLDTKGPEIRSGDVENGEIELKDNQKLMITNKEVLGNDEILTINYKYLNKLKKGDSVLIDDGLIEAQILSKSRKGIEIRILNGGKLGSKKTVALRGHNVELQFLSDKDKKDIAFGIKNDLDFIAASFVRKEKDVLELQKFIDKKHSKIRIISKIEHWEALKNLEEIILCSKGIMVARGDLGVELPMEQVPKIQTAIIKKCNELGKPVIVATQMLESMKDSPRPTRAEISDVANAILEGTDAIMLSGETASGKYPLKAVKMMAQIAEEYEHLVENQTTDDLNLIEEKRKNTISLFVTKAAANAAREISAKAIFTPTEGGFTARKVSRFKPKAPIYAITRNMTILRQLQLSWGVFPHFLNEHHVTLDSQVHGILQHFYDEKLIKKEDIVVITLGHMIDKAGHTNTLEMYRVRRIVK